MAKRVQAPTYEKDIVGEIKRWDERGYPHGSGSKAAEMIAELEEAGCQRFYPQIFIGEEDLSDFDLIMDAFMGR